MEKTLDDIHAQNVVMLEYFELFMQMGYAALLLLGIVCAIGLWTLYLAAGELDHG